MKIHLNIGRMVLEGIDLAPHHHALVKGAAERELMRLLVAEGRTFARLTGSTIQQLSTRDIHIRQHGRTPLAAETLGARIARAVFEKIRP